MSLFSADTVGVIFLFPAKPTEKEAGIKKWSFTIDEGSEGAANLRF